MVGERQHYDALWSADPDFRALFGIRADFSTDMPMGDERPEALRRPSSRASASAESLPPAEAGAVGALVEDGVTRAGRRNRVSTRFGDTVALVREAAHGAGETIGRDDVERALAARARREGLIEERMELMLEEGLVLVSTSGEAVGRVNGLSVYDLGYHAFGKPTRITASAAPGQVGHHQRRARGAPVGEHLRQGRADHRGLPAPPVRRPRPAHAHRQPRVRAVVRRRRRRLRLDRRGGGAGVGAVRAAGRRRARHHRLDQPARRRAADRRRRPQDHRASTRSAGHAGCTGRA